MSKTHELERFEHPFILAPMAGITHSAFRRLMRTQGSAVVISELVSANGLEFGGHRTRDLLKFHPEERPVGLQIFGERPELLVKACIEIEKMGADFVDLNLGCPVPKIVSKGAGSAMCRDPIGLGQTLSAMVKAVKIPVTIKIRTGWDHESRNAHEIVRVAADAGVKWVAIHGRTRAQGYSGDADWQFIAEVKQKAAIPIIGNGDITTPEVAVKRFRESGVDAVMIGRGALRNPFIFNQAKSVLRGEPYSLPTAEDYLRLIKEMKVLLEETFGERGALLHSRKFLAWFSSGFPGASAFRKFVFQSDLDQGGLWDGAYEFFDRAVRDRDMSYLSEPFLMGGHG